MLDLGRAFLGVHALDDDELLVLTAHKNGEVAGPDVVLVVDIAAGLELVRGEGGPGTVLPEHLDGRAGFGDLEDVGGV
jgi:hypothetical protein